MPTPIEQAHAIRQRREQERRKYGLQKLELQLTPKAIELLKLLQDTGIYGSTTEEVAERLIYRGLQESEWLE